MSYLGHCSWQKVKVKLKIITLFFPTKFLTEIFFFFGAVVGNGSCNQLILCNLYYFTILQLGMEWIHINEYLFVYQTFLFGKSWFTSRYLGQILNCISEGCDICLGGLSVIS